MRSILFTVLVVACSSCGIGWNLPAQLETPCGVVYKGAIRSYDIIEDSEKLKDFTITNLTLLEDLSIDRGLVRCEQLKGYVVYVHLEGVFKANPVSQPNQYAAGATWCNSTARRVEVAWQYPHVLIHEYHHVGQACDAPLPIDAVEDAAHADWERSGARKNIESAQLEYEQIQRAGL